MGLIFSKSISENGNELYFTDATTEYGTDLDIRADLALVGRATYKQSSGDTLVDFFNYDPLTVGSFTIGVEDSDGVYFFEVVALIEYTGQELTTGDLVYDTADGLIKRYNGTILVTLTYDELLTYSPEYFSDYALVTSRITILRDNLELRQLEKLEDYMDHSCEFNDYQKALKDFNLVRSLRAGAFIDYCRDRKLQAQQKIETAIEYGDKALLIVL